MPWATGEVLNNTADWLCSSSVIYSVASNVFLMTLIIVSIVTIVLMFVFLSGKSNSSTARVVKTLVYLGAGVLAMLSLHYYALRNRLESEISGDRNRKFYNQIYSQQGSDVFQVVPDPDFSPNGEQPATRVPGVAPIGEVSGGRGHPPSQNAGANNLAKIVFPPPN